MNKSDVMFCLRRDWDVSSIGDGLKLLRKYANRVTELREETAEKVEDIQNHYKTLHRMLREAGSQVDLPDELA